MGEGLLHAGGPLWEGVDDGPGGKVECEAVEAGAVLEEGGLPGPEGCAYPDVSEPGLVDYVWDERGEDLWGADKGT